ncbi:hypothetical protein TKK_0000784 [Trichogramma kaykai]|uniref:Ubiquitin carboxyl-terminal hydrolase 47 n=1 Tax=Trichogramma kaykai TaxID=54128 RepID=A0ABD2WPK8_9HYME
MVQKDVSLTILFIYTNSNNEKTVRYELIPQDAETLLETIRMNTQCLDKHDDDYRSETCVFHVRTSEGDETLTLKEFKQRIEEIMSESVRRFLPIEVHVDIGDDKLAVPVDKAPDPYNMIVIFVRHYANKSIRETQEFSNDNELFIQRVENMYGNGSKCITIKLASENVLAAKNLRELTKRIPDLTTVKLLKYLPLEVHINFSDETNPEDNLQCNPTYPTNEFSDNSFENNNRHKMTEDDETKLNDNLDYHSNHRDSLENYDSPKRIICDNSEDIEPNYVGLVNQAMTCYLNSLLQALYMTPEFRNALYNWEYKITDVDSEIKSIPYQLQKLFLNLQTSSKPAVETTALTTSFGWKSCDAWLQHDIQELCRVMFEALETRFKNTPQADLINRLYEGKIHDYVKCLTCNTEKSRDDTFLDIPLPVRSYDSSVTYESVEQALEAFVKYETLEGNNQYFCEKCNKKSNAHKGLKFTKFPYILTLQLKRFDFDHNALFRIKLNDRVEFPEILNLNSFIEPTSNQESPCHTEDAGINSKITDTFPDDNATDDDCSSNDATFNSNHVNNHDDDDEGIGDMSNGLSSSSCSLHNHSNEILREKYAAAKGPYIYELFSIMIHSGSASGGHYYAYIKDFRTKKWLCFNDQTVKPITQEEIIKSYGGGDRGSNFSATYRCSTNAYMLMYRQIDPERNVLPMQVEDFPPHIKTLVEKMNEDKVNGLYKESVESLYEKIVYYKHPKTGVLESVKVSVNNSYKLSQLVECVYRRANLENFVELDQCRIVSYNLKCDLVNQDYFNQESEELSDISERGWLPELLLDIRKKDEVFHRYINPAIFTKVFVIDVIKKEYVDGPKYIRAHGGPQAMTGKQYKEELRKHFDFDLNSIIIMNQDPYEHYILNDNDVFKRPYDDNLKVSIGIGYDPDTLKSITSKMFHDFVESLDSLITFQIDSSNINEKSLAAAKIPSYDDYVFHNEKIKENNHHVEKEDKMICVLNNEEESASLDYCSITSDFSSKKSQKISTEKKIKSNVEWVHERKQFSTNSTLKETENLVNKISITTSDKVNGPENITCETWKPIQDSKKVSENTTSASSMSSADDWITQETSNSEDSSLSDSDRTLVGDAPDHSELDVDTAFSPTSVLRPNSYFINENSQEDVNVHKYFKIVKLPQPDIWEITMDDSFNENKLKERLEPHFKIPRSYFSIGDINVEDIPMYSPTRFRDDKKYYINLGRVVLPDEVKVNVYILEMNSRLPLFKSFFVILKKKMELSELKKEVIDALKENYDIAWPCEKWRFLEYNNDSIGDVYDQDTCYISVNYELCIQKMEEAKLTESEVLLYIKRWNRSDGTMDEPEELIVEKSEFSQQLIERISSKSKIPEKDLEFATFPPAPKSSVHNDSIESLLWKSQITQTEVDFKTYLLYRNSKETPRVDDRSRSYPYVASNRDTSLQLSSSSLCRRPRRTEKALKIHVDSK